MSGPEFDPDKYRNYAPDLDRLADSLVACGSTLDRIARDGMQLEYSKELGGQAAAWAAMDRIVAAGGSASCERVNTHDPDAWILHVSGWTA